MGTFIGHALPGSLFLGYGLWWTVQILRRWWRTRTHKQCAFRSSAMYPLLMGRWKIHSEGLVGVFLTASGILVECVISGPMRGLPVYVHNLQHAVMYSFFGFTGVVALLKSALQKHIPEIDSVMYLLISISLAAEGLLFQFHLYERDELDVLVHTLLLYVIYITVIVMLVELKLGNSVLCSLGRAYLFQLQGTWFWQVGFVLYNPFPGAEVWDPEDHQQLMLVALIFTVHMGTLVVFNMIVAMIIHAWCDRGTCCRKPIGLSPAHQDASASLLASEDDHA